MYLRHTTRRKDGKVHRYWRLVRSVRVGRKVVQQTVAHLGELDAAGRARAKALARAITGDREQPDLFTGDAAEDAIPVRLKRIRLERGRAFGDVWLGWTLWRALRLDELLARLVPEGREADGGLLLVRHRSRLRPSGAARPVAPARWAVKAMDRGRYACRRASSSQLWESSSRERSTLWIHEARASHPRARSEDRLSTARQRSD